MHCRSCDSRSHDSATPSPPVHAVPVWGADRISGLRCANCGALLGADDIARLLVEKQSQLEQFGLLKPPTAEPPGRRALRLVRREQD